MLAPLARFDARCCDAVVGRARDILRRTVRILWEGVHGFYRHDGFDRASALAFWIVLASVPFLLLFTGLFGVMVSIAGGPGQEELIAEIVSGLREAFPKLDPAVARYVETIVSEQRTLSLTGIPLFLLTSSGLYGTLEVALEHIFHPGRSRTFAKSKLFILGFVSSFMLILLAIAFAGLTFASLTGIGERIADVILHTGVGTTLLAIFVPGALFVILVRFFTLDRVRLWRLAAGGLVFGLLWLVARLLFGVYVATIAPYHWVYGSFATVVVVLVWIYYSAVIFLYAAECVAIWHRRGGR
jgi:membrane protein